MATIIRQLTIVDLGAQFYEVLVLIYKDLDTATRKLLFQENLKEPQVTEIHCYSIRLCVLYTQISIVVLFNP